MGDFFVLCLHGDAKDACGEIDIELLLSRVKVSGESATHRNLWRDVALDRPLARMGKPHGVRAVIFSGDIDARTVLACESNALA